MLDTAELKVWLDSQPDADLVVITLKLKATREMRISYRLRLTQASQGAVAISQSGVVTLSATQTTPLSKLVVNSDMGAGCLIEMVLNEGSKHMGDYRFTCPA